jgi:hypothetical protein
MAIKQFEGIGIIAFYSNGICQGHLTKDKTSPYSLAGQLLKDYKDPHHNDCMDPVDVYKILIQPHDLEEERIELLLRRVRGNDASGLVSVEDDEECEFSFTTERFLSGNQASSCHQKYFNANNFTKDQDIYICIGPIHFKMMS